MPANNVFKGSSSEHGGLKLIKWFSHTYLEKISKDLLWRL